MKKTHLFLYTLLLLVPALLIGGWTLRLLRHEEQRLAMVEKQAAEQWLATAADTLGFTVGDLRQSLLDTLLRLGTSIKADTLMDLERSHPLVRNVFMVGPDGRVLLPAPDGSLTREERDFLDRYQALLQGRVPWDRPEHDQAPVPRAQSKRQALVQQVDGLNEKLVQGANPSAQQGSLPEQGWTPWFWEDGLYLLAWIQDGSGKVVGVELEMAGLLSRLLEAVPGPPPEQTLAVVDANGRIFHQQGPLEVDENTPASLARPIGPMLPHWQLRLYRAAAPGWSSGTRVLSSVLAGLFVVVMVIGGSLLLRQAHRDQQDAQRKTSFVSNVSHELKTPLTTIRMYAELLHEGRVRDRDRKETYLQVIVDESRRLTRLVNNVLDFSRLEQQRKKYRPEELRVDRVVRDVTETQRLRLEQAGLEVNFDLPDHPVPAVTDRDALEQTLLNLLDNALKYAGDGGRLDLRLAREPARVRIELRDYGPGIPRAQQDKIFQQFHRVDDSLTATTQGSGLGLSICRRLMRDQGGDVLYEPAPDGGSIFCIILPAKEDTPP